MVSPSSACMEALSARCVRSGPWGSLSAHPLPRLDHEGPLLHPGASVACILSWNVCIVPVMPAQRTGVTQLGHQDPTGCGPVPDPQGRLSRARHLPSQFTQTESTRGPALAESKESLAQKPLPCRSAHFSAS